MKTTTPPNRSRRHGFDLPPPANDDELMRRLRPRASSHLGLLGATESLAEILKNDADCLERLELTRSEIAERFSDIQQRAMRKWWPLMKPSFHFDQYTYLTELPPQKLGYMKGNVQFIAGVEWPGHRQSCPWGCSHVSFPSNYDLLLVNHDKRESCFAPAMIGHLIGEHGFFAGPESSYRVEPIALARVLDLTSSEAESPQLLRPVGKRVTQRWEVFDQSLPKFLHPQLERALNRLYVFIHDGASRSYLVGRSGPAEGLVALLDPDEVSLHQLSGRLPDHAKSRVLDVEDFTLSREADAWRVATKAELMIEGEKPKAIPLLRNKTRFSVNEVDYMIVFAEDDGSDIPERYPAWFGK